jgi:NTP pyrophosphatase (non-canonical NTP hydrolase)
MERIKNKHYDMVKKLAKSDEVIIATTPPSLAHLVHMALGLVGETIEVKNAYEYPEDGHKVDYETALMYELGDVMFYTVGVMQHFYIVHDDPLDEDSSTHVQKLINSLKEEQEVVGCRTAMLAPSKLVSLGGEVSELIKKRWIYGKLIDLRHMEKLIAQIIYLVSLIASDTDPDVINLDLEYSLTKVLEMNYEKLAQRYSSFTYSNEQAIARAETNQPDQTAG